MANMRCCVTNLRMVQKEDDEYTIFDINVTIDFNGTSTVRVRDSIPAEAVYKA